MATNNQAERQERIAKVKADLAADYATASRAAQNRVESTQVSISASSNSERSKRIAKVKADLAADYKITTPKLSYVKPAGLSDYSYNALVQADKRRRQIKSQGGTYADWYKEVAEKERASAARVSELEKQLKTSENKRIKTSRLYMPGDSAYDEEINELTKQLEQARTEDASAKNILKYSSAYRYEDLPEYSDYEYRTERGKSSFEADQRRPFKGKDETLRYMRDITAATEAADELGLTGKERADYIGYASEQAKRNVGALDPYAKADYSKDTSYREPQENWTEQERNTFYYLYSRDKDEAYEYGQSINDRNKAEGYVDKQKKAEEFASKNVLTGALATVGAVATAPAAAADYLDKAIEAKQRGTITQSETPSIADYGNIMTAAVADALNNKSGTLDEALPVIGGKGVGDAYQLGVSILQSVSFGHALGAAGTTAAFLGIGAKNGMEEAMARGASPEQALTYGLASGITEAACEYLSIDKLLKTKSSSTFKGMLKNVLTQGGIEASEEAMTSLLNTLADEMIMQDKSQLETKMREYITGGMSAEEAEKKVLQEWADEVVYSALGGLLSGAVSSAGEGVVRSTTKYTGDTQKLIDLAMSTENGSSARQLAEEYSRFLDNGEGAEGENQQAKKLSNRQASLLMEQTEQAIVAEAESRLKELGVKASDSKEYAQIVSKQLLGEDLSFSEYKTLRTSQETAQVINEISERVGKGTGIKLGTAPVNTQQQKKIDHSYTGKATLNDMSATVNGRKVNVITISNSGGQTKVLVSEADGSNERAVPLEQITLSADSRALMEAVSKYGESAGAMFTAYKPGQNVQSFTVGWYMAEQIYGRQSNTATVEQVLSRNDPMLDGLSEDQIRAAFERGRRMKAEDQKKAQAKTEKKAAAAPKATETKTEAPKSGSTGKVSLKGAKIGGQVYAAVDQRKLSKRQKNQIAALELLSEITGIEFVMFESQLDAEGRYIGQNGFYANGKIYIDVNAGKRGRSIGHVAIVRTAAHELTHYIQEHSQQHYEELKTFMVDNLVEWQGKSLGDLMMQKMERDSSGELTMQEALDEVIADGCEMMLRRSTIMQKMAKENEGLFSDIKSWVKKWTSTLSAAFKGVSAVHDEARAMIDHMEHLQKLWDEGLAEAVVKHESSKAEAAEVTESKKNTAPEDGEIKYQAREVDKYFERQIDQWDGLDHGGSFRVGKVSEPLLMVGLPDVDIWFDQSKAAKQLAEKEEITKAELKRIPEILNNPIAIAESYDNTVLVFGKIFDKHGNPIVIAVRINSTSRRNNITVVNKIRSIGTRKKNLDALLDDGKILYLNSNKKETNNWFNALGRSTPFGGTKFGLIRIIPDNVKNINNKDGDMIKRSLPNINGSSGTNAGAPNGKASSEDIIRNSSEKSNIKKSERDIMPEDRELLLEAASRKGAGESLQAYHKKYKQLEALNRRLDGQLAVAAAAEGDSKVEAQAKVDKTKEDIAKAESALERMEAGALLKSEADKLRAEWRDADPNAAAQNIRRLQEENESLKEYVQYLRKRNTLTERGKQTVLKEDVKKLSKLLLENNQSQLDQGYLEGKLQELGDYIVSDGHGEGIDYKELRRGAAAVARDILNEAYEVSDDNAELRKDIRNYLRNTTLKISDELRGEVDISAFRKAHMGTLRLGKEGRDIDSAYSELADIYGEGLFPSDITAHYDQLEQILDTLSKLQPTYHQMYSRYARVEAEGLLAGEIIDRLLSGDVRQYESSADKKYAQMTKIYQNGIEQRRQQSEERKQMRSLRINIEKTSKRLGKALTENSAKKHIPEPLKLCIGDFLLGIDSAPSAGTKAYYEYVIRMKELKDTVAKLHSQQEDEGSLSVDFFSGLEDMLEEHIESVRELTDGGQEWKLSSMSIKELERLDFILKSISRSVESVDELLSNQTFSDVKGAINASRQYMANVESLKAKGEIGDKLRDFLTWDNSMPIYAFRRFGAGGEAMFAEIRKGWGKFAMNAKEIMDFAERSYTMEQVRQAEKQEHSFELYRKIIPEAGNAEDFDTADSKAAGEGNYNSKGDGIDLRSEEKETVTMTAAQIMSLYGLWQREQARGHILGAGIRIADYKDAKGKKKAQAENYLLTIDEVVQILSVLSDEQKAIVDKFMEGMNTLGSEWGNEVSLKRWGIEAFTEENYFPIKTDDRSRAQKTPEGNKAGLFRLLNMSFTKQTVKNAHNAVVIDNCFDVFANHMADMAKYNALALPILDVMKWFNFNEKTASNNSGQYTTANIRKDIERVYGKAGLNYFVNFMQDLNGVNEGGRGESGMKKLLSNYKVAAVGANLRVVLQQPTSILRAQLYLKPEYLAKGAAMKGGYEKALKYSGIANWKAMGYFDTNINRSLRERIKGDESAADKIREKSMALAGWADTLTLGALWNACELEVKDSNKKLQGDELMEAVKERFEDVVMLTQVIDSTISRSQNMRSTSVAMSEATSFMSEPTLTYNTILDAHMEFNLEARRTNKSEAWRKHKDKIAKVWMVYAATSTMTAAFAAIADAGRDDDEYQSWVEKWLEQFKENLVDNINPLKLLPFVSTAFQIFWEDSPKASQIWEPINKLKKAHDILVETYRLNTGKLDKPTEVTYYGNMTDWGKLYNVLGAVGTLIGQPLGSVAREAAALWNNTVGEWTNKKLKTYDAGDAGNIKKAFEQGHLNEEEAEKLLLDKGLEKSAEDADKTVFKWSLEGSGVYDRILGAVKANDRSAYDAAMEELNSHDYSEYSVRDSIKNTVKEWYQGTDEKPQTVSKQEAIKMLTEYCGVRKDEAEEFVQQWTCLIVEGIDYYDIEDEFVHSRITSKKAIDMLKNYGNLLTYKAEEKIQKWQMEIDTGIKYSDINDAYYIGDITAAQYVDYQVKYAGVEDYEKATAIYDAHGKASGYAREDFCRDMIEVKGVSAIKDDEGNTITKQQIMRWNYIDSLKLSRAQKDMLHLIFYAESSLKNTPWNSRK